MKNLVVKVKDKEEAHKLDEICQIIYVSEFMNVVGVEIDENDIIKLEENDNVLSFRESQKGDFQDKKMRIS